MTVPATMGTPFTANDSFGLGRSEEARQIREIQREAMMGLLRARAVPPHLNALSPAARMVVDARWGDPCEEMFEYLAEHFCRDLARLVSSRALSPPVQTFAAEALGRIANGEVVRSALLPLLDDTRALVREGAIYGLRNHVDPTVIARLQRAAREDASPGVRQAARDTLAEL